MLRPPFSPWLALACVALFPLPARAQHETSSPGPQQDTVQALERYTAGLRKVRNPPGETQVIVGRGFEVRLNPQANGIFVSKSGIIFPSHTIYSLGENGKLSDRDRAELTALIAERASDASPASVRASLSKGLRPRVKLRAQDSMIKDLLGKVVVPKQAGKTVLWEGPDASLALHRDHESRLWFVGSDRRGLHHFELYPDKKGLTVAGHHLYPLRQFLHDRRAQFLPARSPRPK